MENDPIRNFVSTVALNAQERGNANAHFDAAEAMAFEQMRNALSARAKELHMAISERHGAQEAMHAEYLWVRTVEKLADSSTPQEFKSLVQVLTTVDPAQETHEREAEEAEIRALAGRRTDRETYTCGEEGTLKTAAVGKTMRAFLSSKAELISILGLYGAQPRDDRASFTDSRMNRRQFFVGGGIALGAGGGVLRGASKKPATMDRLGKPLTDAERAADRTWTAVGHGILGAALGGLAGHIYLSHEVEKAYAAWEKASGIPSEAGFKGMMEAIARAAEAYETKQAHATGAPISMR